MKIVPLTEELVPAFKDYFRKYSIEQDDSFPPGSNYRPQSDEPAYLLIDDNGNIEGAAALMIHKQYFEARTGRFRIFHSIQKETGNYELLLKKILNHTNGINDVYCFVEEKQTATRNVWENLGFRIKRYSWILKRDTNNFSPPEYAEGYELKTFRVGVDEQACCDIINEAFADMMGHVHLYPSMIDEWRKEPSYLDNGIKILWHNNRPVATMSMEKEHENDEDIIFIGAIGVLKSYQGRGLGKNLLREGIKYGKDFGVDRVMLSVNAENEKAAELYFKEGFEKDALIICYSMDTGK